MKRLFGSFIVLMLLTAYAEAKWTSGYTEITCSTETARYVMDLKRKELKVSSFSGYRWRLNEVINASKVENHLIETSPVTTEYVFNLQGQTYKVSASFRGEKLTGTGRLIYADGMESSFSCQRTLSFTSNEAVK